MRQNWDIEAQKADCHQASLVSSLSFNQEKAGLHMFDALFASLTAKASEMDVEKLAMVCIVAIVMVAKVSKEAKN